MGKRIDCIKCGKDLPSNRRVYCSNYCQIEYYNKQSKPIHNIDEWGRKFLACGKCKKRLKKVEFIGKVRFVCSRCFKAGKHSPLEGSSFMRKLFKKGREKREVVLEVTQRNRNWHYLNGRPVMGFENALKAFRATCHRLQHRDKYELID